MGGGFFLIFSSNRKSVCESPEECLFLGCETYVKWFLDVGLGGLIWWGVV